MADSFHKAVSPAVRILERFEPDKLGVDDHLKACLKDPEINVS